MGRCFFLLKPPECFSQKTPGIKVGAPEMVLQGERGVVHGCARVSSICLHHVNRGSRGSVVRGFRDPELGTCIGGARDRQIWGGS